MIFRDKWKSIKNHRRWFSLSKWSISSGFRLWFYLPKWPSFEENHPQKVGTHFWGWNCPFSMTKNMIVPSLWQEENPPCRNERKENHPEKLCRHIEARDLALVISKWGGQIRHRSITNLYVFICKWQSYSARRNDCHLSYRQGVS